MKPTINILAFTILISISLTICARADARPLRVAILDTNFYGYQNEIGHALARNTIYRPGVDGANSGVVPSSEISHGLFIAKIFSENITTAVQLILYNVNGFENFAAATHQVIEDQVDVVLYPRTWGIGGNSDGKGFINALVNNVTAKNILWINSAGDNAKATFTAPIQRTINGLVKLAGNTSHGSTLNLICEPKDKLQKTCASELYLNWNDYKDTADIGTDKNLDLFLTNSKFENVAESTKLQTKSSAEMTHPEFSFYPREEILTDIPAHEIFHIQVKIKTANFKKEDQLKILSLNPDIHFVFAKKSNLAQSNAQESLMPPADNPTVITVGSQNETSSQSVVAQKPEVTIASPNIHSDVASALAAAQIVRAKQNDPNYTFTREVLAAPQSIVSSKIEPTHTEPTDIKPTSTTGCFLKATSKFLDEQTLLFISTSGAKLVRTTQGIKLAVPFDPVRLTKSHRRSSDDTILLTASGVHVYPHISNPAKTLGLEIFELPQGAEICATLD